MLNQLRVAALMLAVITATAASAMAQEEPYAPEIDPDNFVTGVNNPYFPLTAGTTFIYEGGSEHIEVFVMPETKEILGIECVVVRDRVWEDGELVEDTFDWYAQDGDGNVWYFGEDSSEIEDGEVVSTAGSWEAGVDGAQPGIIMWANPQVGDVYRQEYYVGIAEDMAEVISLAGLADVTLGSFDDLLVTREWTLLEPDVVEHKYYAANIGLVLEIVVEGGEGRIELVEIVTEEEDAERDELSETDDDQED